MAFYKDTKGIYRSRLLNRLVWLTHGFGTRHAPASDPDPRIATVRQVHSNVCVFAGGRSGCLQEGDALLENTPGALVGIRTADCLPILVADPRHQAVAAIHAGWRGTAGGIALQAIAAMAAQFGSHPQDLYAAIGPGIGACCYEVGPEVSCRFGRSGRVKIDLAELNRQQLLEAGLSPERICLSRMCTMCRSEEFHSYRRDGASAGRMLTFAGIRST